MRLISDEDIIKHYGIKDMAWGFSKGVRQIGKRVAEGLNYDIQLNKRKIQYDNALKNENIAREEANKAQQQEKIDNNSSIYGPHASKLNSLKAGYNLFNASSKTLRAKKKYENFKNTPYGLALRTIKYARNKITNIFNKTKNKKVTSKSVSKGKNIIESIAEHPVVTNKK